MKKKTIKVKRKIVKSKKKLVKRKVKKAVILKRKKKRKKVFMGDIYSILNKAQFGKKKVTFATSLQDGPTIENLIKNIELKYDKVEMKTQVVFTLYPGEKKYEEEDDDVLCLEIMDDEIPDIGQIFG